MNKTLPLDKIQRFVKKYFAEHHRPALSFHTYSRAKSVVKAAEEIAVQYELSEEDYFALLAAAWFQSTGYLISKEDPQAAGANLAVKFFTVKKIDRMQIERISGIIMAPLQTEDTDDNEDILVRILLDALFHYMGTKSFLKQIELERREQQWLYGTIINKADWLSKSYDWLTGYKFHTICALKKSKPGIEKNLKKLRDEFADRLIIDEDRSIIAEKSYDQKKKPDPPEKGVETMFRVAAGNHQRLSNLADNKAHILITVNAIILSAVISLVLRKLAEEPYLIWPAFMLIGVCSFTMVFAILATRPHLFSGRFTIEQLENNETNLLFFGNFYKVRKEDYRAAMMEIMEDKEKLYSNLIYDVHGQGIALARKYRLLRTAYTIFICGLIVACVAFFAASICNSDARRILNSAQKQSLYAPNNIQKSGVLDSNVHLLTAG